MADRGKVTKGLECLSGYRDMESNPCAGCGYSDCQTYAICCGVVARDALELLKEQPDIVRCKDCKYWHDPLRCQLDSEGLKTTEDWFCADGERKENK